MSPSEALTHARIASRSIDVPTTTSEVYLRAVALPEQEGAAAEPSESSLALPEQDAVVIALLSATGLADLTSSPSVWA
ncbi:MAG: hypothetical protein IPN34_27630 [Planctomycetes bacterium]|nr:hypothetical protein [Planctomycetota bacterium]